jgi:hypothetical protein
MEMASQGNSPTALSDALSVAGGLVRGHLFDIMQALQRSAALSYILDSQLRLMYCNPAWNRFVRLNRAPQLTSKAVVGCDLLDALPDSLKALYFDAFRQVLTAGQVWEHSYECSSPTWSRKFRMRIHLLKPQDWFLGTNSLIVERSSGEAAATEPNTYVDANGLITICVHCRCSRRVRSRDQWDFVTEYLCPQRESAVKVSHGLCPVCRAYFYRLY